MSLRRDDIYFETFVHQHSFEVELLFLFRSAKFGFCNILVGLMMKTADIWFMFGFCNIGLMMKTANIWFMFGFCNRPNVENS